MKERQAQMIWLNIISNAVLSIMEHDLNQEFTSTR